MYPHSHSDIGAKSTKNKNISYMKATNLTNEDTNLTSKGMMIK